MKKDHERVGALLKESITVLCKNGLQYNHCFRIQGLLGITLDDDDIFLVDISESVEEKCKSSRDSLLPSPNRGQRNVEIPPSHEESTIRAMLGDANMGQVNSLPDILNAQETPEMSDEESVQQRITGIQNHNVTVHSGRRAKQKMEQFREEEDCSLEMSAEDVAPVQSDTDVNITNHGLETLIQVAAGSDQTVDVPTPQYDPAIHIKQETSDSSFSGILDDSVSVDMDTEPLQYGTMGVGLESSAWIVGRSAEKTEVQFLDEQPATSNSLETAIARDLEKKHCIMGMRSTSSAVGDGIHQRWCIFPEKSGIKNHSNATDNTKTGLIIPKNNSESIATNHQVNKKLRRVSVEASDHDNKKQLSTMDNVQDTDVKNVDIHNLDKHVDTNSRNQYISGVLQPKNVGLRRLLSKVSDSPYEERPHVCQFCLQGFRLKQTLQRHILTHTGEKPHVCSQCGKSFSQPGAMRRHVANVHMQMGK